MKIHLKKNKQSPCIRAQLRLQLPMMMMMMIRWREKRTAKLQRRRRSLRGSSSSPAGPSDAETGDKETLFRYAPQCRSRGRVCARPQTAISFGRRHGV